jgi:ribosomal protein L11 methylase PrmA
MRALDYEVALSDATAFNIQFDGADPVFIDHLSFRPYQDGEFWLGHRQFCEQFLNPLLLQSRCGIPHNAWLRGSPEGLAGANMAKILPWIDRFKPNMLTNVFLPVWFEGRRRSNCQISEAKRRRKMPKFGYRNMLTSLRKLISSLAAPHTPTTWSNYTNNNIYSDREELSKKNFIADFCKSRKPEMIWDIGCNTGEYSVHALENGAKSVIGFEFDAGALETAYARAAESGRKFTPLFMDAANPSPSQGWNQKERDGLAERRTADALLALAVIHHLCIGRNIPLTDVVNWLVECAPAGIIEFVPRTDPMIVELLSIRDDVFEDYSLENFESVLSNSARIVKSETITGTGRCLYRYETS